MMWIIWCLLVAISIDLLIDFYMVVRGKYNIHIPSKVMKVLSGLFLIGSVLFSMHLGIVVILCMVHVYIITFNGAKEGNVKSYFNRSG